MYGAILLNAELDKVCLGGMGCFLVTCWILKKSLISQQGKILFLRKQLTNMFIVKIYPDLYVYTYINWQ